MYMYEFLYVSNNNEHVGHVYVKSSDEILEKFADKYGPDATFKGSAEIVWIGDLNAI